MHRRGIVALACLQFFLQAYFICSSGSWAAPSPLVAQPLISIMLLAASAAIDMGIVRYVLSSIDRTSQAYAHEVNAELDRMLARYQDEAAKARRRANEVALAVEQELEQARATLSTGDFAGTNKHLQEGLSRTLDTSPTPCDNPVIAAVIAGKTQECLSAGITLATHARASRDIDLPDIDLAATIFNLIDNARHECAALMAEGTLESPKIEARILTLSGQLLIEVENPCRAGTEIAHHMRKHPVSQRDPHGLGTGIVTSLARRHGGIAEFDVHDQQFVARVMLPLAQDESA